MLYCKVYNTFEVWGQQSIWKGEFTENEVNIKENYYSPRSSRRTRRIFTFSLVYLPRAFRDASIVKAFRLRPQGTFCALTAFKHMLNDLLY
jgi:hypothetical protein